MTHVSRKRISQPTQQILNEALLYCLSGATPKTLNKMLSSLLTKTEIIMLYKRLGIIYLLEGEWTIQDISGFTKTTKQTIERIKYQFLRIPKEERNVLLKKLRNWKNINLLIKLMEEISKQLSPNELKKKLQRGMI